MAKKSSVSAIAYVPGSRVKAVVVELLDNTGLNRNGSSADYRFVSSVAQFGNQTGFVTLRQMSILGRMYNRVLNNGKRASWKGLEG
jgi:hypothetical protein